MDAFFAFRGRYMLSKKELGSLIKKAREYKSKGINKPYTQQMLANDINKSQSYIGDLESGRTYPSFNVLCEISKVCDVPITLFQEDLLNIGNLTEEDIHKLVEEILKQLKYINRNLRSL